MSYRLFIADDDAMIRKGLECLVPWQELGFELSGLFENGQSLLEQMEINPADVILTDIRMHETTGLDIARICCEKYPDTQVVILSGYQEFAYAQQAMRYRVREYLLKPISVEALSETFQRIRQETDAQREKTVAVSDNEATGPAALAEAYLKKHYAENITLNDVAASIFVNPVYLSRIFHQKTGHTFIETLTRIRIDAAKEQLISSSRSIPEIGRCCGYQDTKYFYKQFKRLVGQAPNEWRMTHAGEHSNDCQTTE